MIAWGGTALLVCPAARPFYESASITAKCIGQAALWLLFAAILLIIALGEKQPLSSLWLSTFRWQSIAWGMLLVIASVFALYPATEWLRSALGLSGYALGMEKTLVLPIWFRVVAVVTAGIVEETLFRAYAITRLARLTGSLWLAGSLSVIGFAMLHLPVWGTGPSFAFLISGAAFTAFFIWRRDLLAMIIAHIAIDAWALLVSPIFSKWWG